MRIVIFFFFDEGTHCSECVAVLVTDMNGIAYTVEKRRDGTATRKSITPFVDKRAMAAEYATWFTLLQDPALSPHTCELRRVTFTTGIVDATIVQGPRAAEQMAAFVENPHVASAPHVPSGRPRLALPPAFDVEAELEAYEVDFWGYSNGLIEKRRAGLMPDADFDQRMSSALAQWHGCTAAYVAQGWAIMDNKMENVVVNTDGADTVVKCVVIDIESVVKCGSDHVGGQTYSFKCQQRSCPQTPQGSCHCIVPWLGLFLTAVAVQNTPTNSPRTHRGQPPCAPGGAVDTVEALSALLEREEGALSRYREKFPALGAELARIYGKLRDVLREHMNEDGARPTKKRAGNRPPT